jgi:hypothetical protein
MICSWEREARRQASTQAYQLFRLGRTVGAFIDCAPVPVPAVRAVLAGVPGPPVPVPAPAPVPIPWFGSYSSIPSRPSAEIRGPCTSSTEPLTACEASPGGTKRG